MTSIHACAALLGSDWASDVRVEIANGCILRIEVGVKPRPQDERQHTLVPGLINLHSHAFQRGMAGLAELRGDTTDTFWTWRDVMYRFALALAPEQTQAIAEQAYMEMLEAGYTRVGEFHYLHHAPNGAQYADVGELAGRICAAAATTGIALTLLPVLYSYSNFGAEVPTDAQRRFINDIARYQAVVDSARHHVRGLDRANVGLAPHSLRAVDATQLAEIESLAAGGPIHMHIAEQVREVDACLAWSGQRPVAWLLDHAAVDQRWCLVHATHMTEAEATALARAGAVCGLCPVTEANLGDGIFSAGPFLAAAGRFGIGTDSNILIDVAGELRQLEYAQRLALRQRNVVGVAGHSTGRSLYDCGLAGGAQALGVAPPVIAVGAPADFVSLDPDADAFATISGDKVLDAWIFASRRMIDGVWVSGTKRVSRGRHALREPVTNRYKAVLREVVSQ